jgi:hypothetical protein
MTLSPRCPHCGYHNDAPEPAICADCDKPTSDTHAACDACDGTGFCAWVDAHGYEYERTCDRCSGRRVVELPDLRQRELDIAEPWRLALTAELLATPDEDLVASWSVSRALSALDSLPAGSRPVTAAELFPPREGDRDVA